TGACIPFEKEYICKDGSRVSILIGGFPLNRSNQDSNWICLVLDLTEHKQVEKRLAIQYAVTQILADSASLAVAAPAILQTICENLGWELSSLWTIDHSANLLRCAETWHISSAKVEEFVALSRQTTFLPGIGLPGLIWSSAAPLWI